MIHHAFGSQDNLWVSPYTLWILGIKLRSSDLVASSFICCAGSSRHDFLMRTYYVVGTGLQWSARHHNSCFRAAHSGTRSLATF